MQVSAEAYSALTKIAIGCGLSRSQALDTILTLRPTREYIRMLKAAEVKPRRLGRKKQPLSGR